jgi:hypothetical protein
MSNSKSDECHSKRISAFAKSVPKGSVVVHNVINTSENMLAKMRAYSFQDERHGHIL